MCSKKDGQVMESLENGGIACVRKFWSVAVVVLAVVVAGLCTPVAVAQILSVPFSGVAAGLAPGTSAAVCSTALDAFGDGCPATQAMLGTSTTKQVQSVWTDGYGNIYIADYANFIMRVIYRGGSALSAVIAVNNPALVGAPQVGYIYALAGPGVGSLVSPNYYCNQGSSGTKGLDIMGDGCPAYQAYSRENGGAVDSAGDIFFIDQSHSATAEIQVIYAGGSAAAKLIQLESGVTAPVVGHVYRIGGPNNATSGYSGDGGLASAANFNNPHSLIVDNNENIYIADTANNVVRKIDGTTGIVSAFAGGNGAGCTQGTIASCTAAYAGDNDLATSASLNAPYELAMDANGNVYIADSKNARVRVVYAGGTLPGIAAPVVGYIYTYAGGGTSTASGAAAQSIKFSTPGSTQPTGIVGVSLDSSGNLYVADAAGNAIWRIDGTTAIGTIFAGGGSAKTVGGYCSGGLGPKATDTVGDGCPATQATYNKPISRLVFDLNDIGYIADYADGLVRSFTFNEKLPDTSVGSTSTVPIAFTSSGSFSAPVLSFTAQGSTTSEFSALAVSCTPGTTYAANTVCVYNLQFSPSWPGARMGQEQAASSGNAVLSSGLDGNGLAPLLIVAPNLASSVTTAISQPASITADALGNVYVSDVSQGKLWKGTPGGTFTALLTGLSSPGQSAVDGAGNVYVADSGNNRIMKLSVSGTVSTLVGGLSSPGGIVSNGNGVLYVADTGNNHVLRYDKGAVTILPISGLSGPTALALDANGALYIADTGNGRIVSIATQNVISTSTTLQPTGLAVDAAGDLYIADKSSGSVLFLPSGSTTTSTVVSGLTSPAGLSLDGEGNLFFTDSSSGAVKKIPQQAASITFDKTNEGEQSAPAALTLTNIGNQTLTFNSSNTFVASGDTMDFLVGQGSPACNSGSLASAGSCVLTAQFTPVGVATYTDLLSFPANAVNGSTAEATLTGTGENLVKTSLTLSLVSPASGSVSYGQSAVFLATIIPTTTTVAPSGSIVIRVDGVTVQTLSISSTTSQFTLSFFPGTHVVSATYSGDSIYASSFSTFSLTVIDQATTTNLSYSASLQTANASLTFTTQVLGTISGTPTGTVTFYNGTTAIGTASLSAQGGATYTTTTTTYPSYVFQAVYSGDTNYAGSASATTALTADFGIVQAATSINVAAGTAASTTVTLTPYFNYSDTLSFSCSGLPVDAVCRFSPQAVIVSSVLPQTLSVSFYTNVSSSLALVHQRRSLSSLAWLLAPILLLGKFKRKFQGDTRKRLWLAVVLIASLGGAAGLLTGCGNSRSFAPGNTPAGTSNVILTATGGSGVSHSVSYTVTVYTNP